MSTTFRTAAPDDYNRILTHIDAGFGFETGTFLSRYPNHWRYEFMDWEHLYLALEGDEIAAFMRVFPLDVVQNGAKLRVGGLGAVSTTKAARGQGHMSELLHWTNRAMREEGFALAVLDGDRHRYGAYGYESAGRAYQISIGIRGLKRLNIKPIIPYTFKNNPTFLARISALYAEQPYRRIRPSIEIPWLYESSDYSVWASSRDGSGDDFAYLVLWNNIVAEWGGTPETILGMVQSLQEAGAASMTFRFPTPALIPPLFDDARSHWSVAPSAMIQVLDATAVLQASANCEGLPSLAQLEELEVASRAPALFGGLHPGPLNYFLPRTERI